ncbi:MAG TPA: hypothetical protein VJV78_22910 [Polyangiales bacterium]|nr:hypothetical protein [Polyangiales bacterium]
MATACLFLGWDRPRAGREREAFAQITGVVSQLEKFREQGYFERHHMIGLTPHCGTLNSFILLEGDRAKLDELRRGDDFERFSMQLGQLFEGYGVVPGITLEGLQKFVQRAGDLFR